MERIRYTDCRRIIGRGLRNPGDEESVTADEARELCDEKGIAVRVRQRSAKTEDVIDEAVEENADTLRRLADK